MVYNPSNPKIGKKSDMGKETVAKKLQTMENILANATTLVEGIRFMLDHPDTLRFLNKNAGFFYGIYFNAFLPDDRKSRCQA